MINIITGNNCLNTSEARRQQILAGRSDEEELIFRDHILRLYIGWIGLPIAIPGLIGCILFISAASRAIREHRVRRRFYALLLNRAFGDLLTCVVALVIFAYVVMSSPHVNPNVIEVFHTLYATSFWSALITYVCLGILKLYGVAQPLHYRNKVTMRTCIRIIAFSWAAFGSLTMFTLFITALVKIDLLAEWSGCDLEKCLMPIYRFRRGITAVFYVSTIVCFIITVILIRRAKRKRTQLSGRNQTMVKRESKFCNNADKDSASSTEMQQVEQLNGHSIRRPETMAVSISRRQTSSAKVAIIGSRRQPTQFALIRLTVGVASLAVFHFPHSAWALFLSLAPACYFSFHWETMQKLRGLSRVCVLLRIVIDVIVSFCLDPELRVNSWSRTSRT
ncbi:serpentine type 7TM GPCR chemoreceptor srx domain-containing protein [Ditylenchus destructor]|uniref:Serpentine type 7TM GPCR chemoreceptor srx domain-containing protein n=1 Tax=Ditylenchus destructor TaxID=166010 RepID=A0AAD4NK29_9BILA|nr:serpentine type 7TM GPCR chemoreceptor srx domain-containing protein [Ditylenchus destructor]